MTMSASSTLLPFYSSPIRVALEKIVASQPHHSDEDYYYGRRAPGATGVSPSSAAAGPTAVRGSWRAAAEDYSSSDGGDDGDDDDNNAAKEDAGDSDDEEGSSSSSSMGAIGEEGEADECGEPSETVPPPPADAARGKGGQRHGGGKKKSRNKKSRDDVLRRLGRAPSVLLPLQDPKGKATGGKSKGSSSSATSRVGSFMALEMPGVLLPINFPRDYNPIDRRMVGSAARSLLATWNEFHDGRQSAEPTTVIVALLQSGRFAAAVFSLGTSGGGPRKGGGGGGGGDNGSSSKEGTMKMIAHRTSTRYTVRKGQGGSQSSHDQSRSKAKSVGAQLRREGERQLREDAHKTWREWKNEGYVENARFVFVSCPKGMRRDYLFGGGEDGGGTGKNSSGDALVEKNDDRLRNVPLDVGRPTMEATAAVLDRVLGCSVRDVTNDELGDIESDNDDAETSVEKDGVGTAAKGDGESGRPDKRESEDAQEPAAAPPPPPFTSLHEAVLEGNLSRLVELLRLLDESEEREATESSIDDEVNSTGGPDRSTALHVAASSTHPDAPSLIDALLVKGHADPCALDSRGRPPYFLAASDTNREAFRLARGKLGEDFCRWDEDAKVGPALTDSDVQAKKAKALEKKRRQRARQKERKAAEKAEAEKEAKAKKEEEEKRKREEDAKRVRDGLKPKAAAAATNVCDFCQKVVRGKRRSQMFQRLDYAYCSTECVKRHQRELMAAAATARMG